VTVPYLQAIICGDQEITMRIRWILLLAIIMGLGRGAAALMQGPEASELLKTADEMARNVARLRGLEPKAPISKGVKDRAEIAQYLNERIQKEYDPKQLQLEGKVLQKLGLIPATVDYRELSIRLLTDQAAGFYDEDKKAYFIASWLPVDEQKPTMIHELTHALQDQYFDLKQILETDRKMNNDDRTLAHGAFIEGDGMAVMIEYILQNTQRHFADLPDLALALKLQMSTLQDRSPIMKSAPSFMQETLLFPYGYGSSFLQQVWKKNPSWKAIDKIYSDLPASTEQIMHPEKYFGDRDEPKPVNTEALAAKLGSNWKTVYKNVLGEFGLGQLLNLHYAEGRARRAASGWGGDQVLLLENEDGKEAILVDTVWDTADDSDKFFTAMEEWFGQHYPKATKKNESPTGFSLIQKGEFNSLRHEGTEVRFILGFPEAESKKLSGF
jgi:hypothetical protein